MSKITIVSHLSPEEWKASWEAKVVEDSSKAMKDYHKCDCFCGRFYNENDFLLFHHKEFESKTFSLGMYFTGRIEKDVQGSKITEKKKKKWSANLFLGAGAALSLVAFFGSLVRSDYEIAITAAVLLVILVVLYFARPKKEQALLQKHLEKISFDDSFHGKAPLSARKHLKRKRTMKEKATVKQE